MADRPTDYPTDGLKASKGSYTSYKDVKIFVNNLAKKVADYVNYQLVKYLNSKLDYQT